MVTLLCSALVLGFFVEIRCKYVPVYRTSLTCEELYLFVAVMHCLASVHKLPRWELVDKDSEVE